MLIGGTVAHLLGEETYQELFYAGSPWRTIDQGAFSGTHVGVIVGLDIETHVTRAVAVVAQARGSIVAKGATGERSFGTVTLPVGLGGDAGIARLGLGVRWMF
jgi:hypothetical protein